MRWWMLVGLLVACGDDLSGPEDAGRPDLAAADAGDPTCPAPPGAHSAPVSPPPAGAAYATPAS